MPCSLLYYVLHFLKFSFTWFNVPLNYEFLSTSIVRKRFLCKKSVSCFVLIDVLIWCFLMYQDLNNIVFLNAIKGNIY